MKKYEITEYQHPVYPDCFRIRAKIDIPLHNVKAGDLGGYVMGPYNLSDEGSSWIADDAVVKDEARVADDGLVRDRAVMCDYAGCFHRGVVAGNAVLKEEVWITGDAKVAGNLTFLGAGLISDSVKLTGSDQMQLDGVIGDEEYLHWFLTGEWDIAPVFGQFHRTYKK